MKKEEYIEKVLAHIQNKAFVSTIRQEIEGHIDDRELYYKDCGYDTETAQQKAIEHMGSAEKIGEEMNKLHKNIPALVTGIISIIIYIFGFLTVALVFISIAIGIVDNDNTNAYILVFSASLITFASGAICYNIAYKNKFDELMAVFGITNLVGMLSPITFIPFGYSIAGFIFNFNFALSISNEDFMEYPRFFGSSAGEGAENTFCYIIILILTYSFILAPLISGIISVSCAKKMNSDLSDNKTAKMLKHFKHYGILLLVLSIIGTATLTAEIAAHHTAIVRGNTAFEESTAPNAEEAMELFNSIELPISKDNLDELNSLEEYSTSDAKEFGSVTTMIHQNNHYTVQLWDNDADGFYEEKRIFSSFSSSIKESDFDKIKEGMRTEELFEIIPIAQVSDYSYVITDNGYEENIDLYADGELIKHFISANLHIVCKNGIITELEYSPAQSESKLFKDN